jgi:hypothetical protein
MQNFLSNILSALASSLTPHFSGASPFVLGLLLPEPLLAALGLAVSLVGWSNADRVDRCPPLDKLLSWELLGGVMLWFRVGGVMAGCGTGPPTEFSAGSGPFETCRSLRPGESCSLGGDKPPWYGEIEEAFDCCKGGSEGRS